LVWLRSPYPTPAPRCATPPRLDQEQGFDAAVRVPTVFGHFTGRERHRDVAEDMDLGAQNGFLERAQSGRCEVLHPRDESLHRRALRRPGGRIKRCVGVEIGGEHLPRGLVPRRPTKAPELPGYEFLDRLNIAALPFGCHDALLSFGRRSLQEQPSHNRGPMQYCRNPQRLPEANRLGQHRPTQIRRSRWPCPSHSRR
jgi:hypothetical protein